MKNRDKIPTCDNCFSDLDTVFKHLTPEEHAIVDKDKVCNFYKRGNIIYHEGNRTNGFYCINSGVVKIFKTGIDGREQIIAFAKKGDIIGFRSILSNELACSSSKVIDDAVLCFVPGETLISLVKTNGNFSMAMMQQTCKELGEANSFITDIAQKTVRERLAEVLLNLKNIFDLDADQVLQISLTREELANIVGTATESVIRLLSEFKHDKLIDLNGRKIKLLNIKQLEKISNAFN
ncbi:MAG: cyclic nucleotide-binding domain-containing protein [Bacteroidales bacterium]|nr:cyclic nucleotide-binding domain-containing protein [Bacteroidales bacterium]